MKFKLTVLLASLAVMEIFSAQVSVEQSKQAAKSWVQNRAYTMSADFTGKQVSGAWTHTNKAGRVVFHCVNFAGGGYVVTAADDSEYPVIVFADKGEFKRDKKGPLWALAVGKNGDKAPGGTLRLSAAASAKRHALWDKLLSAKPALKVAVRPGLEEIADVRVLPLIETKWGQEGDDTGEWQVYNRYTPNNYPCGCVALAMAQLMYFHKYPTREQMVEARICPCKVAGVATNMTIMGGIYDWDKMFTSGASFTEDFGESKEEFAKRQDAAEAVGKLTHDCGVAARTEYDSFENGGSGSLYGIFMNEILTNNFCYKNGMTYIDDTKGVALEKLKRAICPNLDAGYPVSLVVSHDTDAHQLLADGYGYTAEEELCFHLNLGWDGICDMWYVLPAFKTVMPEGYEGEDSTFTIVDAVIYNIFPNVGNFEIVSGRVLDASGNPVVGAMVTASEKGQLVSGKLTNTKGIYSLMLRGGKTYEIGATYSPEKGGELKSSSLALAVTKSESSKCIWERNDGAYYVEKPNIANLHGVDLKLRDPSSLAEDGTLITMEKAAVTVKENVASLTLNVKRIGGKKEPVIIKIKTVDLTAKCGEDYEQLTSVLSWGAGDTKAKKVTIKLLPDLVDHWEEAFKQFKVVLEALPADSGLLDGNYFRCDAGATQETLVTITETAKMNVGKIDIVGYDDGETAIGSPSEENIIGFDNPQKPELLTRSEYCRVWLERTGGTDGMVGVMLVFKDANKNSVSVLQWTGSRLVEIDHLVWNHGEGGKKSCLIKLAGNDTFIDKKATFTISAMKKGASFKVALEGDKSMDMAIPYAAKLGKAKSLSVKIRDSFGEWLEERVKKLGKASPVTLGGTKNTWYTPSRIMPYSIYSTPVAPGKTVQMTFTVNGPGILSFSYINLNNFAQGDEFTIAVGKAKAVKPAMLNETEVDYSELEFDIPAGKQKVTLTYKAKKPGKGEKPRESNPYVEISGGDNVNKYMYKLAEDGGHNSLPCVWMPASFQAGHKYVDKSVVAQDFTVAMLKESFDETVRIAMGASKKNLSYDFAGPFEPGKTYFYRADTVMSYMGAERFIATNSVVNSFAVIAEGAPPPASVVDYSFYKVGDFVGNGDDVLLRQGVKAQFAIGTTIQDGDNQPTFTNVTAAAYALIGGKLPAGLTLDAKTGIISGVPTAAGTNVVAVQIKQGKLGGQTQALRFIVRPLGVVAGKTFNGVATGSILILDSKRPYNEQKAGVTFTVGKTGALSAKVSAAGKTFSFKTNGFDAENANGALYAEFVDVSKFGKASYTNILIMTVNVPAFNQAGASAYKLEAMTGFNLYFQPAKNGPVGKNIYSGIVYADLRSSLTLGELYSQWAGYYTAAIVQNEYVNILPMGHGYLTAAIDAKANVKFAGRLSDGTAFSASCVAHLLGENVCEMPFYFAKDKMLLAGSVQLQNAGEVESGFLIAAPLMWNTCDANALWKDGEARQGFITSAKLYGGYYSRLYNLQRYYYDGFKNFGGDLVCGAGENDAFSIVGNKLAVDKNNSLALKFDFKQATGIFTGSMNNLPAEMIETSETPAGENLMASEFADMIRAKKLKMEIGGVMIMTHDGSQSKYIEGDGDTSRVFYPSVSPLMGFLKVAFPRNDAKKTKWVGSWPFELGTFDDGIAD